MTVAIVATTSWQVASDGTKACYLVRGRANMADGLELAIADTAPAAGDVGFPMSRDANLPKGVKAWVRGKGTLYQNYYTVVS